MNLPNLSFCIQCFECLNKCSRRKKTATKKAKRDNIFNGNKRKCARCNKYKEPDCFYTNTRLKGGLSSYCRQCQKEYNRTRIDKLFTDNQNTANIEYQKKYYLKNKDKIYQYKKEYNAKHIQEQRVRGRFNYYRKKNNIKAPELCELCGRSGVKIHPHHPDYSKPLDVQWLCKSCHQKIHWTAEKGDS